MEKIINSKSKTFLAFCFCFMAGAGLFSYLDNASWTIYLYAVLLACLFMLAIFWRSASQRFVVFCLLFFISGGLRFNLAIPENTLGNVGYYNGSRRELAGTVAAEPDVRMDEVRYFISLRGLKGKVLLTAPLYPRFDYGDGLRLDCLLKEPRSAPGSSFDYEKYLLRYGVQSLCAGAKIEKISAGHGSSALSAILRLKTKVGEMIGRLYPEPKAGFLAGLLYGSKSGLPKDLSDNFSRTGVTHIIAVSGFNITIIVTALMVIFIRIGFYRRQAFWAVAFATLAFVFFTGASASVVRAAIMGLAVLIGQYLGRAASAGRPLVFAAAAMVLVNPYILWWDAGFQLSFLSTLGLVYLSPCLQQFFSKRTPWLPPSAAELLSATLAAIIATTPLILYQFGRLSAVAPLVNLLILWLVPWLMLFGFLSLLAGFIFFPLGQILAWLTGAGLGYVIMVVNWFGNKKWSAFDLHLPWWGMSLMYAALLAALLKIRQKEKIYARESKNLSAGVRL